MKMVTHEFYLAVKKRTRGRWTSEHRFGLSTRITERQPALKSGEVAIKVRIEVPEIAFQKPTLRANIIVPEEMVAPAEIVVEVGNVIADEVLENFT